MTRIRASCPSCGEVDLRPDDVTVKIVRAFDGLVGNGSSYRFCCPDCEDLVVKPADERIVELLTTGGVPVEESPDELAGFTPDLRPPHPEFPGDGPPLNPDDLLDLHLELATEGWFDELLATTPT